MTRSIFSRPDILRSQKLKKKEGEEEKKTVCISFNIILCHRILPNDLVFMDNLCHEPLLMPFHDFPTGPSALGGYGLNLGGGSKDWAFKDSLSLFNGQHSQVTSLILCCHRKRVTMHIWNYHGHPGECQRYCIISI